jgi:copper chaperone CopZ
MVGHSSSAEFKCPDIHIGLDVRYIMQSLLALDGVLEASTDLMEKTFYVRFDPERISMQQIEESFSQFGFKYEVIWEHD